MQRKDPSAAVSLLAIAIACGFIGFICLIMFPPLGIVLGILAAVLFCASIVSAVMRK